MTDLPSHLLDKPALGAFTPRDPGRRRAWLIEGCRRRVAEAKERGRIILRIDGIMRSVHMGVRFDIVARDLRRVADEVEGIPAGLLGVELFDEEGGA